MKVRTTRFGDIEVPDDRVFEVADGILGFPDAHRFVLLEHDSEGTPFRWLQACDDENLAFIVIDPNLLVEAYEVELDAESAEKVDASEGKPSDDLALIAIVNVPHDEPIEMTVNLRAPIVVNSTSQLGRQVILSNEDYPIRHRIFPDPDASDSDAAEPEGE